MNQFIEKNGKSRVVDLLPFLFITIDTNKYKKKVHIACFILSISMNNNDFEEEGEDDIDGFIYDFVEEDDEDVADGGAAGADRIDEIDLAAAVGGEILDQ